LEKQEQIVVDRPNVETEYRLMALLACELVWIKQFLQELEFCEI